jgi:hypothetical protein
MVGPSRKWGCHVVMTPRRSSNHDPSQGATSMPSHVLVVVSRYISEIFLLNSQHLVTVSPQKQTVLPQYTSLEIQGHPSKSRFEIGPDVIALGKWVWLQKRRGCFFVLRLPALRRATD